MSVRDLDRVYFRVDPVILTFHRAQLSVLLVKRASAPYEGLWGLPGGRVDKLKCADLNAALLLKLKQKTGIDSVFFEQLATYGGDRMDPRGWSVTTAYLALVHASEIDMETVHGDEFCCWKPLTAVGRECEMAFWHQRIICDAYKRLRDKSLYTDLPVNFMPEQFTYPMLRRAYEAVLGISISRQAFAKRMDAAGIFVPTGAMDTGRSRPSPLYRRVERGGAYVFPGIIKGVNI